MAMFLLCVLTAASWADSKVMETAAQLEAAGKFKEATAVLTQAAGDSKLTDSEQRELRFEIERLERVRKDYPLTETQLFNKLARSVANLSQKEFEQWVQEGRFDSREIDGTRFFMSASVANLFFRHPELNPRRRPQQEDSELQRRTLAVCRTIKEAAKSAGKPYVLPVRFDIKMTVTSRQGTAPSGEKIRAWLPIPREYPYQGDFELRSCSSAPREIAAGQSPIRSVLLEQPVEEGKPTVFQVEYRYTRLGIYFDLQTPATPSSSRLNSTLEQYTREGSHIVFSQEMRDLARKIAGDERNPCLQAKKFYDWISENIRYSFATEYSTIRNVGDYCRRNGYGDCGQEALLFMTLCRLNGIPARWQSGWNLFPGAKNIHDWCEIHLEPYGWIPVDPYMGTYAMRYADALTSDEKRELRDFYFGGMDEYRLAANSDHCQELQPAKQAFRSDNVDFQRGELEWGEHNIYFDRFSYDLKMDTVNQDSSTRFPE